MPLEALSNPDKLNITAFESSVEGEGDANSSLLAASINIPFPRKLHEERKF